MYRPAYLKACQGYARALGTFHCASTTSFQPLAKLFTARPVPATLSPRRRSHHGRRSRGRGRRKRRRRKRRRRRRGAEEEEEEEEKEEEEKEEEEESALEENWGHGYSPSLSFGNLPLHSNTNQGAKSYYLSP